MIHQTSTSHFLKFDSSQASRPVVFYSVIESVIIIDAQDPIRSGFHSLGVVSLVQNQTASEIIENFINQIDS